MSNECWFEEQEEQSAIKSAIVAKYFWAWAKVIMPTTKKHGNRIAYIDLFAGEGRFRDGSKSTPLLILEQAIQDKDMRKMLVAVFNDKDSNCVRSLEEAVFSLPGIEKLKHKPQIYNEEVGEQIVAQFEKMSFVPTLFFVDPWGYKGLSQRLINSVLKNWGCDCIVFFNYNRINMGLSNPMVAEHMNALLGKERVDRLRPILESLPQAKREPVVIEALCEALKELGSKYVLPFRFRHPEKVRTSHHLVFVSKHPLGYKIMKGIMAAESSTDTQGVPSFEYNPVAAADRQGLLFQLSRPLDDLREMVLEAFAGETLKFAEVFNRHHVDTPFIDRNYKEVLGKLENDGILEVHRPPRSKKTYKGRPAFGKGVTITFPERNEE
jgi:three-Cys-motif partner protein